MNFQRLKKTSSDMAAFYEEVGQYFTENTEHSQSLFRVIVMSVFSLFFLIFEPEHLKLLVTYCLISLFWFLWTTVRPEIEIRKYMGMVLDCTMVANTLYLLGPEHVPPYLIYFWIILGNGYRFGSKFSKFGILATVVTFWSAVFLSPLWANEMIEALEMTIILIVISLFSTRIIFNLEKQIKEARHFEMASLTDPLTSLHNRAFVDSWLNNMVEDKQHAGVLFIDLDNFKEYNDTHGHEVGDQVLVNVSRNISNSLRTTDIVCRFAGDEFVVLVDSDDEEVVNDVASRIKGILNQTMTTRCGIELTITGSVGVSMLGVHSKTVEGILKKSDDAMYKAKRAGRNQVVWA